MKLTIRPFNFNLPDHLRDYLEFKAATTFSNMTKYLIDMISTDMDMESVGGRAMNLAQVCQSDPELGKKAMRFILALQQIKGRNKKIMVRENVHSGPGGAVFNYYDRAYVDLSAAIRKEYERSRSNCVICHPAMKSFVNSVIPEVESIVLDMDAMRYHVVMLKDKNVSILTMMKDNCLLATRPDEHDEYFFDQKLLKGFSGAAEEENKQEASVQKDTRIKELNKSDGTTEFLVEKYTKPDGSFSPAGLEIAQRMAWDAVSSHSTLQEAKDALNKLREIAPSIVKEVIHEF